MNRLHDFCVDYDGDYEPSCVPMLMQYEYDRALTYERLDILSWICQSGYGRSYMCVMAELNDRLDILRLLHEQGCEWTEVVTTEAAMSGRMECLLYALENGCPYVSRRHCIRIAPRRYRDDVKRIFAVVVKI